MFSHNTAPSATEARAISTRLYGRYPVIVSNVELILDLLRFADSAGHGYDETMKQLQDWIFAFNTISTAEEISVSSDITWKE